MSRSEAEVVSEAELVELFRRRRVDPAAFRARIAQRVAERASERRSTSGEDRSSASDDPSFATSRPTSASARVEIVRRAAALVPLDPSGSAGVVKLVLAGIALPFAVLAATLATLAAAGRSVHRSASTAPRAEREPRFDAAAPRPSSGRLRAGGWVAALLQPFAMLAMLLPSFTGDAWAVDVVVGVMLVAAATTALLVRGLADEAWLTPRSIARCATALLGATVFGLYLWPHARHAAAAGSDLGLAWSAGVLLVGLATTSLLARPRATWRTAWGLGWVVVVLLLNPLGLTRSSPASVRGQLADLDLRAESLSRWEDAALAHEALVATGDDAPPRDAIEREVERALREGLDAHPRVWTTAARVGVMTRERWATLASRPIERAKLDQLLALDTPLRMPDYDEYLVPMLLATRAIGDDVRERLAARIDAGWPSGGVHDPLSDALLRVRILDELGLAERADARRDDVHALVRSHAWPGRAWGLFQERGGFTPDPVRFETSMPRPTHAAVALMARFGVPEGIDVRAVRDYLRAESAATWLVFPEVAARLDSRATLLRLEREIGLPPRSLLASLAAERVLVACVALVLLCLLAILSAPRPDPSSTSDARVALP